MGGALAIASSVLVPHVDAVVAFYGAPSFELADPAKKPRLLFRLTLESWTICLAFQMFRYENLFSTLDYFLDYDEEAEIRKKKEVEWSGVAAKALECKGFGVEVEGIWSSKRDLLKESIGGRTWVYLMKMKLQFSWHGLASNHG
ncbi:hypothetical protein TSUD_378350 [Trifolium subterraneum]|uniref:Uncharacterized protein n=1 Tax=Trifolium subterraneum TaxID=3900 RepID=A0A2Z6P5I1_TRISU|nr:hypothetical protein TSUD_378350 [Trifolium subterraneum]